MVLRYHAGKQNAREALYTGLVYALVNYGKIETTVPRSREARKMVERIVNIAREDSISSRRRVLSLMDSDRKVVEKIFKDIAPRFKDRNSGFTTVKRLGKRKGDASEIVRVEWVVGPVKEEVKSQNSEVKSEAKETKKKVAKKAEK